MTHNSSFYSLAACIIYTILYVSIAFLATRYNRIHQYRHEDDIELQYRDTAKDDKAA